ncbi:hypothetical protein TDB9533_00894 [Thalassocella blandensis]|nr:hypothetical protein TDB9533_00894 [Thalassocella blandensis]
MFYSIGSAVLWATTGIFIKYLHAIPVGHLLWFRFLLAMMLSVLIFAIGRRAIERGKLLAWRGFGLASLMTAYYIFATTAFSLAPVSLVVLVIAATPVIAFILQFIKFRMYHLHQVVGFVVTLTGISIYVAIQSGNGNLVLSLTTWIGAACALGAACVRALYAVIVWHQALAGEKNTESNKGPDALLLSLKTVLLGSVICIPGLFIGSSPALPDHFSLLMLLGLAGIATVLPTLFNTLASARIDPVLHNIICMSTPVLAGAFAWILLDEKQSVWSVLAAGIIVLGIVISIRKKA